NGIIQTAQPPPGIAVLSEQEQRPQRGKERKTAYREDRKQLVDAPDLREHENPQRHLQAIPPQPLWRRRRDEVVGVASATASSGHVRQPPRGHRLRPREDVAVERARARFTTTGGADAMPLSGQAARPSVRCGAATPAARAP